MKNALSIDLEDWFCAHNLVKFVKKDDWEKCESRLLLNTEKILNILRMHEVKATIFILGWVAERFPEIIRKIDEQGHEIASHGYNHLLLNEITPKEFEIDIQKSIDVLKKCHIRQHPIGFRAPSFTLLKNTMWVLEILEKYNFKYDSSVFPIGFHPDYGISDAPLGPYKISSRLYEFPMSCVNIFGKRIPCGGGAYFRFYPYGFTKYCLQKINQEGRSAIFYIHPWEFDPGQPKFDLPFTKRLRHYYNLNWTEKRFDLLLTDFKFTTIKEILGFERLNFFVE
jgi:polysaccharide deacetylase family protein (PEP-CTERM system associated)